MNKKVVRGNLLFVVGFLLLLAGGLTIKHNLKYGVTNLISDKSYFEGFPFSSTLLSVILAIVLILVGWKLIILGWKYKASTTNIEKTIEGSAKKPVLYLRPFYSDKDSLVKIDIGGNIRARHPFEVHLKPATAKLGPLIAIGNPSEELPRVGAARSYFDDHSWKEKFYEYAKGSQLIVLSVGLTAHIAWELVELLKRGYDDKLIIHVPFQDEKVLSKEQQWNILLNKVEELDPAIAHRLPPDLQSRFIYFESPGNPVFFNEPSDFNSWMYALNNQRDYYVLRSLLSKTGRLQYNTTITTLLFVIPVLLGILLYFFLKKDRY